MASVSVRQKLIALEKFEILGNWLKNDSKYVFKLAVKTACFCTKKTFFLNFVYFVMRHDALLWSFEKFFFTL